MDHTFSISYSESGKFVASSVRAPYFCFEADTEDAVVETARRALNFYHGADGKVGPKREASSGRQIVTTKFRHKKTIKAMEVA